MIDEEQLTPKEREALAAARAVRANAYAPYSEKQVGAAVITDSGRIFAACNMENQAKNLCVCAERNAIAAAIVEGERQFHTVIVIAPDSRYWPPCDSAVASSPSSHPKPRSSCATDLGSSIAPLSIESERSPSPRMTPERRNETRLRHRSCVEW